MLSILCVRLTIKVKVRIPESFKVGWYPLKKTGSSHLKPFCIDFCAFFLQQAAEHQRFSLNALSIYWQVNTIITRRYAANKLL